MASYLEALRLLECKRIPEAVTCFNQLARESGNLLDKANYLIEEANCHMTLGQFDRAIACVSEAKGLKVQDDITTAQIEYFEATILIAQGKREDGLRVLSQVLSKCSHKLSGDEARKLYEDIQTQRAFTLMHLCRYQEARSILEEVVTFEMSQDCRADAHCQLARCYFELSDYKRAKEQCLMAQELGPGDDWASTFHYYFGYTLYELKEFEAAKRQAFMSLQSSANGPPRSYILKLLAATYRKLGDHDRARECARAAETQ